MELHKHKDIFYKIIEQTADKLSIEPALVEKDYFVFLVLSKLNKEIPGLLFKGGTSLSSAYHLIDRFSEDIDLTLDNEHYGRAKGTNANHKVIEVCEQLGFNIINKDIHKVRSHASFNRYFIEYPSMYSNDTIKRNIQLELVFFQKAYPSEIKKVNSLIGNTLESNHQNEFVEQHNLYSFEIRVQSLERTFIDKVFAVCDYFEREQTTRNSRHIYDLYKIYDHINLSNNELRNLIESVKNDRKKNKKAISAQDAYRINDSLRKIKETEFYKQDYENTTKRMLIKKVEYTEIITVLDKIIDSDLFKN